MDTNKYEATCSYCKKTVPAGEGVTKRVGRRYNTRHKECVGKVAQAQVTQLDEGQWRVQQEKGVRSFGVKVEHDPADRTGKRR
jgi:hypothetical protein